MANYYMPLPAQQYPTNALLDFSPITQALANKRNQENLMYERRRNALADARANQEFEWKQQDRDKPQFIEVGNNLLKKDKDGNVSLAWKAPDMFEGAVEGMIGGGNALSEQPTNQTPEYQTQSFMPDVQDSPTPYYSRANDSYVTTTPNNAPLPTGPTAPVMPVGSQRVPPIATPPQVGQQTSPQQNIDWNKIDNRTAFRMMQDPLYKDIGKMILEQRMKTSSGGLSKETANAVQKDMYETSEGLSAIKGIKDTYKKEFTYWNNRLQYFGYWTARKMGTPLSEDQIKEYAQYTVWKRRTLENINKTIQRVTGASMGVQEAGRIMSTVPNLDDDDIAFEAKMGDIEKTLQTAMLRYRYYLNKGFFANGGNKEIMAAEMSIDQFRGLMNDRKAEIADEIRMKNPSIQENALKEQVGKMLRREFGGVDI